ncbi:MAG: hypothetical protein JWM27_4847 [Gemmatimonadetes bacterium]|nr:hypothetical protein [Gemmatimonadota bacterium]
MQPINQLSFDGSARAAAVGPAFARHETFHPRHGWLKKGFDAALIDSHVFLRADAPVVLGVGKNMVRAIRYWCHAFRVLETTSHGSVPTSFGRQLLGPSGWDPYLEDLGSLWLLHQQLLAAPSFASAWEYAFLVAARPEFTPEELLRGLSEYAGRTYPTARNAESSLRKDVTCILRMYASGETTRSLGEESIRCPFVELGLISPGVAPGSFAFSFGDKPGLTPELICAASLRFATRTAPGARTVALARLLRDREGPAAALKLTEASLYSAIEEVVERYRGIDLSEAGGIVQLTYSDAAAAADELTRAHYERAMVGGAL